MLTLIYILCSLYKTTALTVKIELLLESVLPIEDRGRRDNRRPLVSFLNTQSTI